MKVLTFLCFMVIFSFSTSCSCSISETKNDTINDKVKVEQVEQKVIYKYYVMVIRSTDGKLLQDFYVTGFYVYTGGVLYFYKSSTDNKDHILYKSCDMFVEIIELKKGK
jgi:hypothetical protein